MAGDTPLSQLISAPAQAAQPATQQPKQGFGAIDLAQFLTATPAAASRQANRTRSELDGVGRDFEDAMKQEFDAKRAEADQKTAANRALFAEQQRIQRQADDMHAAYTKKFGDAFSDYDILTKEAQTKIDPNEYAKSLTGTEKLAMILAAGVAELKGGQNDVLQGIDMAITRNIRAQEANAQLKAQGANRALTALSYFRQVYGDDQQALEATKAMAYDQMATKLQGIASDTDNKVLATKWLQMAAQMKAKKLEAQLAASGGVDALGQAVKRSGQLVKLKENLGKIQGGEEGDVIEQAKQAKAKSELAGYKAKAAGEPTQVPPRETVESIRSGVESIDRASELEKMLNQSPDQIRLWGTAERERYQTLAGTLFASYRHYISGAGSSDREGVNLQQNIPSLPTANLLDISGTLGLSLPTIQKEKVRAKAFIEGMKQSVRRTVDLNRSNGYKVSKDILKTTIPSGQKQ